MATQKLTAIQVRHLQMLRDAGIVRPDSTSTIVAGMRRGTLEALGRKGLVHVEKQVNGGWTTFISFEITAAGREALEQ